MLTLTVFDGRKLAAELEETVFINEADVGKIAATLRQLSDNLEATLKVANDLASAMDTVHKDRVMLSALVVKLTGERDAYRSQLEEFEPTNSY